MISLSLYILGSPATIIHCSVGISVWNWYVHFVLTCTVHNKHFNQALVLETPLASIATVQTEEARKLAANSVTKRFHG